MAKLSKAVLIGDIVNDGTVFWNIKIYGLKQCITIFYYSKHPLIKFPRLEKMLYISTMNTKI